ncbi:MAG: hypothetical protein V9E83_06905 [Baekduia sp.]
MGFFKQMKDMKNVVDQAPDMIRQAQGMQQQATEMQAAQQAAAQQAMAQQQAAMAAAQTPGAAAPAGGAAGGAAGAVYGGVTMEQFATVCRRLNNAGGTPDQGAAHAAGLGISAESWAEAETGFSTLMQTDPSAGTIFRQFYDAAS